MKYWLMKSEPTSYSIDQLRRDGSTAWEGVRNFQARNYMRDEMKVDDLALFYHSNVNPPGVAGIARISKIHVPDYTALDPKSLYYDPKATKEDPIWIMVQVEFVEKFSHFVTLEEIKHNPRLKDMLILRKGSRLSITPIEAQEFRIIRDLGWQNILVDK